MMLPRIIPRVVNHMRWTLLLSPWILLLAPLASAEAVVLFEDDAGDAGPLATWGVPVPGLANDHADLTRATIDVHEEGATLTLSLAALPATLPPDTVWFAGWQGSEDRYLAAGYLRAITPEAPAGKEGASLCAFEGGPQQDETPECADVEARREGSSFWFTIPIEALGDGALASPGGAVVRLPDATAWPLFVAHFTGLTVEDFAQGDDVLLPRSPSLEQGDLTAQSAKDASRAVPGAPWAAPLALAAAILLARR